MAHIQKIKLKRGTAHQVFWYEHGVQKNKYFPAKIPYQEVKKIANELEIKSAYDRLGPGYQPSKSITLDEFKEIYLEKRRNEIDLSRHQLSFKILLNYFPSYLPIDRIDHSKINEFRDHLFNERKRKINAADLDYQTEQRLKRGVNKELQNIRTIFRWAKKKGYLRYDVFENVDFYETSNPLPRVLTEKQEYLFYHALPKFSDNRYGPYSGYRLAWQLIKYTGFRRSEIMQLKWEDLDFDNRVIHLAKTKNRDEIKFPMHPKLWRILKFLNRHGKYSGKIIPFNKWYLSTGFRRALNRAGLKDVKSPVHVLRHTFVTKIVSKTHNIYLAQKMARHRDIKMTKVYEHVALEELNDDLAKIDF